MVAYCVEVESEQVHALNGGLIVKQRRHQRTGANQVTGRDHDGIGIIGPQPGHPPGQQINPAHRHPRFAAGGLQVAMEIVEGQDLDFNFRQSRRRGQRKRQHQRSNKPSCHLSPLALGRQSCRRERGRAYPARFAPSITAVNRDSSQLPYPN